MEAGKLLLSRNGRQVDDELEGGLFQFRASSIEMIARTTVEFENSWRVAGEKVNGDSYAKRANYIELPTSRPVSDVEREAKFSIHAEMSSKDSMVYGFEGEHFQEQADLIMLHVVSADETIDLRLGICGFHRSHEVRTDFVMASGVWSVELRSIILSTTCSPH